MLNKLMINSYCRANIIGYKIKNFLKKEDGVTAVEYAIVVAGIAAVVLVVFGTDGPVDTMLTGVFTTLQTKITALMGGGSGS
ncbi:Flp family type IVb pilin [Budvicia aquatica]|uniref:Flp family type IVb pilin n=1 Tax=Budvicia aquatica TaxID=82979 RepID=A0A2C6DL55_9GAMM|nr:Flp family type IVb pilin [Budvicia aquatica]PHI29937.1 Flp family type IVb pilin [Budvicia aquatica]VFS48720.1 Flp pilus assembly protein, pilin Flp [Budvicia aquatica]